MEDIGHAQYDMKLPAILDLTAASPLKDAFLSNRGRDIQIDGTDVQRLGAQCLQVLLAARATWDADGHKLLITSYSAELIAALELFGVAPETLVRISSTAE